MFSHSHLICIYFLHHEILLMCDNMLNLHVFASLQKFSNGDIFVCSIYTYLLDGKKLSVSTIVELALAIELIF